MQPLDSSLAARPWGEHVPPVIMFNKSHSGSRILARLMSASGLYLGAEVNESEDAFGLLDFVRPLVEGHYPDYSAVLDGSDTEWGSLAADVFRHHLSGCEPGRRWGWKLCETLYILPVLWRMFPSAYYVHLVRDGRDVAFSDHVSPRESFWRKVYFDTAAISRWKGMDLTDKNYRRNTHLFNARHWVNSVSVARHFGAMIGSNYIEVKYEDLVGRPRETACWLLERIGVAPSDHVIDQFAASVRLDAVGKFRKKPIRKQREAEAILRPTLEAFGYGLEAEPQSFRKWFWG